MYKIAICDDDRLQVTELEKQISHFFENLSIPVEMDCYYTGERLINAVSVQKTCYQLIFLDIEMEGLNGIEVAKSLRQVDTDFILIYVTSYEQYALDSFEVSPFRYVIKPVSPKTIVGMLDDILTELTAKQKFLFYQVGSNHFQVRLDNIMFLYSEFGRKIHLKLASGDDVSFYGKISSIEGTLPLSHFVRVNSGTIINLNYVASLTRDEVIMENDACIAVSRSRKKSTLAAYNQFIERNFGL